MQDKTMQIEMIGYKAAHGVRTFLQADRRAAYRKSDIREFDGLQYMRSADLTSILCRQGNSGTELNTKNYQCSRLYHCAQGLLHSYFRPTENFQQVKFC